VPARVPPERWAQFDRLIKDGANVAHACREAGISYKTGSLRVRDRKARDGRKLAAISREAELDLPAPSMEGLSPEARLGLTDFEFFRLRYFGHVSTPWQVDAANRMIEWLESDDKEFVVVNVPPGAGKSTLFTHDIPAWALVRARSTRILIGSRTERQARQYVGRLKTSLERTHPPTASDLDKKKGLAVDAVATLTGDYGRFKPTNPDVWRNEEFTIAQVNDIAGSDKERSVSAYGMDGGFLGGRYDLVIWDDLVDKRSMRTSEARETLINMWETEAETRLEPGGLLILQGQRMRSDDLYRYALDLKAGDPDDYESEDDRPMKYRHIIYRAHDDARCDPSAPLHKRTDPAWRPDGGGCLLDPVRVDWKSLKTIQSNKAERYLVMYQQEDIDPQNALVDPLWVSGGRGLDGVEYPGCWDRDRGLCEFPRGLTGDLISVATADPSPSKFWSIQWWLYHPESEQRFLLDLIRQAMDAPDFLDWSYNEHVFTGVMEEWQQRSKDLGVPITTWVFEANAAQRFVLQYDHAKRWQRRHSVDVVPHQTHRNKHDDSFGVQTIAPHWRHGRVRLPGRAHNPGKLAAMKLVDEVTRWQADGKGGGTDDCVMAEWFFEYNLPHIYVPGGNVYQLRPTGDYLARKASRGVMRGVGA
jgi:hypothetical protein